MKKKLLYVINAEWYFELHWLERAKHAVEQGFDVAVIVPYCDDDFYDRMKSFGISVVKIKMSRTGMNPLFEIKYLYSLNKFIEKYKPDLVHSVTIKPNLYCTMICSRLDVKLLSTYAGLGTLITKNSFKTKIARKVTFSLIRFFSNNNSNFAMFENDEDKEYFVSKKIIPDTRTTRVYGAGVNLSLYSYSPKKEPSDEFVVLFASRLLKDKGLDDLKEAVCKLYKKGVSIRLDVAGIIDSDSPLSYSKEDIEYLARLPYVNWLGERKDIPHLISDADLVALPTTYGEGVPRILIEAASVGRPIVTTKLGGCKDICLNGYNGLSVDPNCPEDIEAKLSRLINDFSFTQKLGENGRKLVEKTFSNEIILSQHISLYNKMIEGQE